MNFIKHHVGNYIEYLLYAYFFALLLGYAFKGHGVLFDEITLIISLGLGLIFILLLKIAKSDLFTHIAMVGILFLLFIFPRILTYLYAPEIVALPFSQNIEVSLINNGLLYLAIGTAFFIAGMFSADIMFRTNVQEIDSRILRPRKYPLVSLSIIFFIIIAVELYATVWLGVSPYGKLRADNGNTLLQFIKGFFALDTFFYVVLCIAVFEKTYKKDTWLAFVIVVFITYAIYTAFSGSRGVGIRTLLVCSAIFLAAMGNFKPRIILTLVIIASITLTSFASWPLATSMRSVIVKEQIDVSSALRVNIDEMNSNCAENFTETSSKKNCNFISKVLNRMGVLDYAIQITSQPGDPKALEKYMNFSYLVKSIANSALPGLPFLEAPLSTSRVLNIIYRDYDEIHVLTSGYFSEYWTIWGIALIYFGWWGGLIALFAGGFILQILYSKGATFFGKYSLYYKSSFLFLVTSTAFLTMGLDHSIFTIMTLSLQIICTLVLLNLFDVVISRSVMFYRLHSSG